VSAGRKRGARGKLTSADLVSLGLLTHGPAHGHEIWTRLSAHDGQALSLLGGAEVSRAQVYYSLDKLAARGLIRSVTSDGRADRRTWRITAEGQRALTDALSGSHWAENRVVSPFITWLALSEHAWPAVRKRIIAERRAFLDAEIARERATLDSLRRISSVERGVILARQMVELVIQQFVLELDWLDDLESAVSS
jgi:DNA-binding PadR family transcriptional regulator